jgi:putative ABC transport system permease protein
VVLPCNKGYASFRGVTPSGASLHGGVVLPAGALAERSRGVLVGAKLAARDPALAAPGVLRVGPVELPIAGVLEAPGTPFESEVWIAQATLAELHLGSGYSTLRVPVRDDAHLGQVREAVARMGRGTLEAHTERDFFALLLARADAGSHEGLLLVTLFLLVAAGIAASTNAMYSVALSRRSEFFTLTILGFPRLELVALVVQESLAVNLVGGALGLVASRALVHGRLFEIGESQILTTARFSPAVVAAALGLAAVVGLVGGAIAALQALASRT